MIKPSVNHIFNKMNFHLSMAPKRQVKLLVRPLLLFFFAIFFVHYINFTFYLCPRISTLKYKCAENLSIISRPLSQTNAEVKVSAEKSEPPLISATEPAEFRESPAYKYINNPLTKELYDAGFDITNADICPGSGASMKLLIIFQSGRKNVHTRMDIRRTYGHHYALRKDVAKLFILGRPGNLAHNDLTSNITAESNAYGDVVVGRFVDSFHNMTLKTTSALEWVATYCSKVKFILKADDDTFLNIPRILDLIESWSGRTRAVIGELITVGPCRNKKDKHYVSTQEYSQSRYPAYAFGPAAYFITGDIVQELFMQGLSIPYLSIDDAFYSGFVAQAIGARKIFYERSYRWHNYTYCHGPDSKNKCNFKDNVSLWAPESKHKRILWNMTLTDRQACT